MLDQMNEQNKMRRSRLWILAVLLAAGLVSGCSKNTSKPDSQASASRQSSNAATTGHDHAAESAVDRVGVTEAQALVERGEAVFLDVRQSEAYSGGHIKGAVPMPEAEITSQITTLPKNKKIITYCS